MTRVVPSGGGIAGPFIRRPIATTLLAIGVLLAGAWAYTLLPVSPLPRVDFPTISISASLPGASPETMASAVATPLERRFGRIAGVTEITSTNVLGTTNITLQFDLDRDVDSAARDVQAAIAAAGGELPTNLPFRPTYRKVNPADSPVMIVSMTSDTVPLAQVFEAGNSILAQKISQVPGVGQVTVGGGQQPAVRIQADPKALAGMGLSLADVRVAVGSATANEAKGSIAGIQQTTIIGANDQLFGADAFRSLVIAYRDGAPVRLNEVADVFDDVENNRVAAWHNGKRAVLLIIRRQPGSNIIDTTERVTKLIPDLVKSISPAINVVVAVERTKSIKGSVRDVEKTLLLSVLLVIGVVFVFLRSVRATLIPSVAVPLSLVGTFGVMYLLGYSLDNLSLMALTISTGFVVDDAIVVTENITRYVEQGKSPLQAALEGARQIGFTILSITASLLAVFIPLLLMGGIVGRLFREFAVTLSIAIGFSALVSLTLTPMMCSRLLRPVGHGQGRLYTASERFFGAILRGYEHALDWVLRHRHLVQLLQLGTVALTVYLFIILPKGLFPQQDLGQLMGFSEAAQDVSFKTMRERQLAVNQIVQADPDVANVVSFIGSGNGSTGNTGTVFVDLKAMPPRQTSADQVIARLRPKLGKLVGINLFMQAVQDVRVGGRSSRTQYQYTLRRRPRRAPILGSAGDGSLQEDPDFEGRGHGSTNVRAHLGAEHRPRHVGPPRAVAFGHRRRAVRCLRSTPNCHDVWPTQPIPSGVGNQTRIPGRARKPAGSVRGSSGWCPGSTTRRHALCRHVHTAFDQSPRAVSGDYAVVQPNPRQIVGRRDEGDRRGRAGDRHATQHTCRVPGNGAGFFRIAVESTDAADDRAPDRVHRARCALRKLRSSAHDLVHDPIGRRWRAARVALVQDRVQRDRARGLDLADRNREEERDHDDRFCERSAAKPQSIRARCHP